MLMIAETQEKALSRRLLNILRPIAGSEKRAYGMNTHAPQLFSYCCFSRERLASVVSDKARIGIVLSGAKEFWIGDTMQRYAAGDMFCLPAGVNLDVVNIPSETTALYESLLVEVETVPEAIREMPGPVSSGKSFDLKIPLSDELVDAVGHAAIALNESSHSNALAQHRLEEVLMLLRPLPQAAPLFERTLADQVFWAVRANPLRRWTAETIGRELGLGASTLRRRLSETGQPLREVLTAARLQVAHELLIRGETNVTDAINAAGYTSRSHFIRQFKAYYGTTPGRLARTAN